MSPLLMSLPNELLLIMIESLPKSDLISVRLTFAFLSRLSARFFSQRVYFALRKARIEGFRNIAQHPVLCRDVRELVYDAGLFDSELAHDTLKYEEDYFDLNCHTCLDCHTYLDCHKFLLASKNFTAVDYGEMLRSQASYVTHLIDQEAIVRKKGDLSALATGLKNMPRIERLSIEIFIEWLFFRRRKNAGCLERALKPSWNFCTRHISESKPCWRSDIAEKLNDDFWDTFASAGIKLKQLNFGSDFIQLPLEAFDLSSNGLAALNSVCPDLRRLHLSLNMEPHIHSENSQTNADLKRLDRARYQLSQFLKSLKTLQEFSISMNIYWTTGWEKVVMDQFWPHLTVLILSNVEMIPEIFEKNHSPS